MIKVYGKVQTKCQKCDAAKEKLVRMGLPFEVRDIDYLTEPHEGWQEDGSVDVLAGWALRNQAVPLIKIEERYYTYPEAMKELKKR